MGLFLPFKFTRDADVWEFNSVSINSPIRQSTIPQTNPITIYSLTDIIISTTVGLAGGTGTAAPSHAVGYSTRAGGVAARTALDRRGGFGERCCGGNSERGVGPGGGGGARYSSYGPGGGGGGHASAGGRGANGGGTAGANPGT